MGKNALPLQEVSIDALFNGSVRATYEVPIYQRNFAWEKDEITALVADIYDAYRKDPASVYYIGTLVSFYKGDNVFEIIDGQQRLTTLMLLLKVLEIPMQNKLTYRARQKAAKTIEALPDIPVDEPDMGIVNGYRFAKTSIDEIPPEEKEDFKKFFQRNVHMIHYHVPRDIDLNHYFEIMNSRGEQLEKHEIVKAALLSKLENSEDRNRFNRIWESCSDMRTYLQENLRDPKIFGSRLEGFTLRSFDEMPVGSAKSESEKNIKDLLDSDDSVEKPDEEKNPDFFQPIIDFPNFLLIVLKLTRIMDEPDFSPTDLNLDDKELLNEFEKVRIDERFAKRFGFNLLKAKYLLDNCLVHHSNEEDRPGNNPWKLQRWQLGEKGKGHPENLAPEDALQAKLIHLLSMFEVSFTARQRKNYLFYCLLYLFENLPEKEDRSFIGKYCLFVEKLADKYFRDVYLAEGKLNAVNTPLPGSFDETILQKNELCVEVLTDAGRNDFLSVYGDGTDKSRGIPLFVFNYLDFKLWELYAEKIRGEGAKKGSLARKDFFATLGCSDFDLNVFDQFYFSRTRRSLEHFYPRANAGSMEGAPDQNQIDCFGNYAMIGSEANSSGSNWTPKTKLDHYLDTSGKVRQVSVASIKFSIMMQKCKDNDDAHVRPSGLEWKFEEDIKEHQNHMLDILFPNKSETTDA